MNKAVIPSQPYVPFEFEDGPPIAVFGPADEYLNRFDAKHDAVSAALADPLMHIEGPDWALGEVMDGIADGTDLEFTVTVGGGWFVARATGKQG